MSNLYLKNSLDKNLMKEPTVTSHKPANIIHLNVLIIWNN